MKSKIFLFTLFAVSLADDLAPAREVTIEQGVLNGKLSVDGTFFEYLGIPYATTNKSNRFKAPLPPPSWEGVYKAEEMYTCPQINGDEVIGTEDCLKINVYVPAVAVEQLPVMIYIHGGAFHRGSGGKDLLGPEFLIRHDVIVVTFNYRLGAFGFICLGIEEAPGNAGLKDQIAALRWVKKNIAAFGGDPDSITLFGGSAGATSTSLLIASESTMGLFNKAIVQSGSALAHWAFNKNPVWIASLLTNQLGYNTEDPYEIYKILSKLPYEELTEINPLKPLGMYLDTELLHIPCIENSFSGVESVLTDLPINLLNSKPKNIPVIYGSTSKEGIYFMDAENENTIEQKNHQYLFASDLEFVNDEEALSVNKRLKEFYFGDEQISMKNIMSVLDLYTALFFEIPVILESELVILNNDAPVYNYYFNYDGGRNFMKNSSTNFKNVTGASHGDDTRYIFDAANIHSDVNDETDQLVIDWMTTMWTNFAKYGDPTPSNTTVPVKWEPSNKDEFKFLYIEDELKMGPLPNDTQYQLWKDIYTKYRPTNISFLN